MKINNQYIFILGNNYKLSILEILNYFKKNKTEIQNIDFCSDVLLIEFKDKIEERDLIKNFGGTIKISKILDYQENMKASYIVDLVEDVDKIHFGFSFYNFEKDDTYKLNIRAFGIEIKNRLKNERNISSRFVISNEYNLSSVSVKKNRLLRDDGYEFIIVKNENTFLISRTMQIQEFEEYGDRDFGRPNRDSHSGMLPPKLCKMMINLTDSDKKGTVLDPFCGSGTMIQELLVLDYKNIIGSDISNKAIDDSIENLKWLLDRIEFELKEKENNEVEIKFEDVNVRLFEKDVLKIEENIKENSVDSIVCESFLGSTDMSINNINKIKDTVKYLEEFYINFFKELQKILKEDSDIVIVFPVFKTEINYKIDFIKLNIIEKIEKLGFEKFDFNSLIKNYKEEDLGDIMYYRENQKVYRQIYKFIKK